MDSGGHTVVDVPVSAMCEERRCGDAAYEVIPQTNDSWKVDVGDMLHRMQDAYDKAAGEGAHPAVVAYYAGQVELWSRASEVHVQQRRREKGEPFEDTPPDDAAQRRRVAWGTQGSLALNVVLLVIKFVAYVRTGSTTVMASLADSVLDLCSGSILIAVSCYYDRAAYELFPTGKHRFEPLGTLVFSCLMFVLSLKLLQEVVDEVIHIDRVKFAFDLWAMGILLVVTCSKAVAAVVCGRLARGNAVLRALAEDHRNDVVANSIAVGGYLLAVHVSVWFDPLLAFVVTVMIMRVWGLQIMQQLFALSGHVADDKFLNLLIILARNHDFRVTMVDTVRAVTAGDGVVVEVDIVLPPEMPLCEAHDITEHLQLFLEGSPLLGVARAYVHADVETTHNPALHM